MMEGAYFVGRGELLSWLNNTFQLAYTKIEETCSGHYQILLSLRI
jgi:RP/EB family microtubule-associated protein